jgi:hypothetical protein
MSEGQIIITSIKKANATFTLDSAVDTAKRSWWTLRQMRENDYYSVKERNGCGGGYIRGW